jgi:hypothetical protein
MPNAPLAALVRLTLVASIGKLTKLPQPTQSHLTVVAEDVSALKLRETSSKKGPVFELRKAEIGAVKFQVLPEGKAQCTIVCKPDEANDCAQRLKNSFTELRVRVQESEATERRDAAFAEKNGIDRTKQAKPNRPNSRFKFSRNRHQQQAAA